MVRVSFSYPGRPRLALDDVSLSVPAGSTVALVGPSGAGKTTVANLFLRFWDPTAGEVRLHGHDLRRYRLDDLRARIALVAQDTYLFNDTLRANIRLARPGASEAEVAAAVERAALREFVESLPEGLDTVVGERGAQLSGGQRQRVAIARAFLKDAPVLILDEATSHLDAVSEQEVRRALDRLTRGRTTVVIAHRLSTVRDADRILVFDEGRLVETGDPRRALRRQRAVPAPGRPPGRRRARRPRLTAARPDGSRRLRPPSRRRGRSPRSAGSTRWRRRRRLTIRAAEIGRVTRIEKSPREISRDCRSDCSISGPRMSVRISGASGTSSFLRR